MLPFREDPSAQGMRQGTWERLSVSHLLHTRQLSQLRAFLYKICNVEREVLHRLIDLNVVLPRCCRPDPIMVFLQPAEQTPPRLRGGPTPVRAHTLFPQIPQGLIPMVVKELENLLEMLIFQHVDILSQLCESELRLGFAVRMVKDMHQLPNNSAEAVHKPCILSFQFGNGLLFLSR